MLDKIWVDTNIFIRFYRHDDAKLSPLAEKIISDCIAGKYILVICPVTILEIVWLLTSLYKLPKAEIVKFIENILATDNLKLVDEDLTKKTVMLYKEKNIDVVDAYFSALMEQHNVSQIFSFDHDFDKISEVKRLERVKIVG